MKLSIALLAFVFSFSALAAVPSEQLKQRLAQDLEFIAANFANDYAPRAWKEKFLNWNLSEELKKAQGKIAGATDLNQVRQAAVDFLNSTSDYHVGYSFYSTEKATLPFSVRTVESKTLVVYIDRSKISEDKFDLETGDELVAMNEVPVSEILKDIAARIVGHNVQSTDEALADLSLTRRRGARNLPVPRGPVSLAYKKAGEERLRRLQLVWDYSEEMIPSLHQLTASNDEKASIKTPKMLSLLALDYQADDNNHFIGMRKSFLPDLGSRIWETATGSPFDAYIYQNEQGKLIGVVRIPSYVPENVDAAVEAFAGIVKKMQKNTSALVIDQLNNPGGSVFYLYTLASMLTDTSLTTPRHRMALRYEVLKEAAETLALFSNMKNDQDAVKAFGQKIEGYPVTYELAQMLQEYCKFVLAEAKAGKKLSEPFFLWGVDHINPHPEARYTKPVMILTNELDFSGGDFFPATLQDNKRVTVVGTRTAGAGGYVLEMQIPNAFGLERVSFTGSIAERADKNPIENLGVTPDVVIPMTVDDYRNSFKNYLTSIQAEVSKLTQ
jgi:hypothetical protein